MTHLEALKQHEQDQQAEKGFDVFVGLVWFILSIWLGSDLLQVLAILVLGVAASTLARVIYLNSKNS